MSASPLYRRSELLDPKKHRRGRIAELTDWSVAATTHAVFLTATEFTHAAIEYPILFVRSGERDANGRERVVPVALLGLVPGENLFVEGARWDARYTPAFVRRYPFYSAPVAGVAQPAVFLDTAWSGYSETAGEPLFEADDKPAPALKRALEFLERFELEAQRTRQFCDRLVELDLLKDMRADVTLFDSRKLAVEGFHAVDEDKLQALPDATVVELHRSGVLMLMQVHLLSLGNMRHLVERKAQRVRGEGGGSAPGGPAAPDPFAVA